jgi:hypothetical protein
MPFLRQPFDRLRPALSEVEVTRLRTGLKGTGYRVGLLLNFGASSLEYSRRVL